MNIKNEIQYEAVLRRIDYLMYIDITDPRNAEFNQLADDIAEYENFIFGRINQCTFSDHVAIKSST